MVPSLTWLWNFKEPEGQLAQWIEKLQESNFTISHRPGRRHQNAHALSQGPCTQCGKESHVNVLSSQVMAKEKDETTAFEQTSTK